jgi:hypothetical protein
VLEIHPTWTGFYYTVSKGKVRYRLSVSRDSALATAGEITGTGGSPHPDGFSVLETMCTSTVTGASTM